MTKLRFAGIADVSTVDYIGKLCAVVYLCGCPFRCPWCQNPDLVSEKEVCKEVDPGYIIAQLKPNFLIEAVTITGGEPLMQEATIDLLEKLKKDTKLLINLDTNGNYPGLLKKALPYVDYVSMDIKAPLDEGYKKAVGLSGSSALENVGKSLSVLKEWPGVKEARTTIVPGLVDRKEQVEDIARTVKDAGFKYYTLQQFIARNTLDPGYMKVKSPSLESMHLLGDAAKSILKDSIVRVVSQKKGIEVI